MSIVNLLMNLDSIYFNLIKNKKNYMTHEFQMKKKILDVFEFKEKGTKTFKVVII